MGGGHEVRYVEWTRGEVCREKIWSEGGAGKGWKEELK